VAPFTGASALGLVLAPAGDAEAWDCGGVGRPVVRRNLNGEEESWLMWYEGWSSPPYPGGREGGGREGGKGGGPGGPFLVHGPRSVSQWDSLDPGHCGDGQEGQGGRGQVLGPSANWWSFDTRHVRSGGRHHHGLPHRALQRGRLLDVLRGHLTRGAPLPPSIPEPRQAALLQWRGARGAPGARS